MVNTAVCAKTNGEFIEILLATEASGPADAKNLLSDFAGFKAWLQLNATSESVECIAEVFSARVYASLESLKPFRKLYQEKLRNIQEFLNEICRTANSDFGLEITLDEADNILGQV